MASRVCGNRDAVVHASIQRRRIAAQNTVTPPEARNSKVKAYDCKDQRPMFGSPSAIRSVPSTGSVAHAFVFDFQDFGRRIADCFVWSR